MTTDYRSIIQALHDDPETKDELARCTDWDEAATVAARLAKRHGHDVTPRRCGRPSPRPTVSFPTPNWKQWSAARVLPTRKS